MKPSQNESSVFFAVEWSAVDKKNLSEAEATEAKTLLEAISSAVDLHINRRAAIMADTDLSESGRDTRVHTLIEQSDVMLEKITRPMVDKLKNRIHTAASAIAAATATTPSVQDTLRMIEARAIAAAADPAILEGKLKSLAQDGTDDLTVHAILSASALQPLVRDDVAAYARDMLAMRLAPTHAIDSEVAVDLLATIDSSIRMARHSFGNLQERARLGFPDRVSMAVTSASIARDDAPGA